jgi:hypothetical protein
MITIITDCRDDNAKGRQLARAQVLFGEAVNFIGVKNDIEASGNLIDALDAVGDGRHVIMVNVAPRNGKAKKWSNGTPFGYFWYRNTLVVATVDGLVLSLAKRFGVIDDLRVTEIAEVAPVMVEHNLIDEDQMEAVVKTQFRSFNYMPRLAKLLFEKIEVPNDVLQVDEIEDVGGQVWWVDSFGNLKTTFIYEDQFTDGELVNTNVGQFIFYSQLKAVPDGEIGLVKGSSGLGKRRFLELMKQGGDAAKELGAVSGTQISF